MTVQDDGTGDTYSDYPDESNVEFSKVQFRKIISRKIAFILYILGKVGACNKLKTNTNRQFQKYRIED